MRAAFLGGTETKVGFQTGLHTCGWIPSAAVSDGAGTGSEVKLSRSRREKKVPYLELCDVTPDRDEKEETCLQASYH